MTSEQRDAVARVVDRDPDPDVRADAERVLRGEPMDPPEIELPEADE